MGAGRSRRPSQYGGYNGREATRNAAKSQAKGTGADMR